MKMEQVARGFTNLVVIRFSRRGSSCDDAVFCPPEADYHVCDLTAVNTCLAAESCS